MNGRSLRAQQERAVRASNIVGVNPRGFPMDFNLGDDVTLHWTRRFINGAEEDHERLFERQQQGWEPVKASEVPERFRHLEKDGMIQKGGCVLMKIPKDRAQAFQAFYEQRSLGIETSARNEFASTPEGSGVVKSLEKSTSRLIRGKTPIAGEN